MKNIWIYFLLVVSLSACASSSSGHEGCSFNGELCIGMHIEEPVLYGDVNTITITVSSFMDIDNLVIYLYGGSPDVQYDDVNGWSNRGVKWVVDIEANKPQTFLRNVLLPEHDGHFDIITSAITTQTAADYSLIIYQQQSGSTVYYANTPVPYTPQPLQNMSPEMVETLRAMPTRTPYPTLILNPTNTCTPIPPAYPPPASPTSPPMEGPGEEPYP